GTLPWGGTPAMPAVLLVLALVSASDVRVRAQDAEKSQQPSPAPATAPAPGGPPAGHDPLTRFDLPDAWESRFWSLPGVKELTALDPRALAELVPVQAGIRHCRCPGCDADETDDPLGWSVQQPRVLTCRRCGLTVPNDEIPARDDQKHVPEE